MDMKNQKIVFWLGSGEGYTFQDVCLLCDYHERTGLMDVGMTDADIARFAKKYLNHNDDYGVYDDIDPAGGYGLYSHV